MNDGEGDGPSTILGEYLQYVVGELRSTYYIL